MTILIMKTFLDTKKYVRCARYIYDMLTIEQLANRHSNIFVSSSSFYKLKRLENCSFYPNHLKITMKLLFRRFDEIYNSSCMLPPPLLVPTLDFYIGSYSVSFTRGRLHLVLIDCYAQRECYGSYEDVLEQQGFPTNLIEIFQQNRKDVVKSYFGKNRNFSCIFKHDMYFQVSPLKFVSTHLGGSAYCRIKEEILQSLKRSQFSLKVLLVAHQSHHLLILSKLNPVNFDLNLPLSLGRFSEKPFELILACAPLTWAQIKTNILLEWIIYHRLIGVGHFLIYIKETDASNVQHIVQHLEPFIYNHTITLINWHFGVFFEPENAFQIPQMIDAVQRTADFSTWTMIADTDEFFYPEHHSTVTEIVKSYGRIAQHNLSISYRQELTIQNVHMMKSSTHKHLQFITGKYFGRHRATRHPLRSKIIAYSGGDRFLAAEEVHFFASDSTFVPEQFMRLNHYFHAYNHTRMPLEKIHFTGEDSSLWERFGDKIQRGFDEYQAVRKSFIIPHSLDCNTGL